MGDFIYYIDSFDVFISDLVNSIRYMIGYFFPLEPYSMYVYNSAAGSYDTTSVVPCFTMLFIILLACFLIRLVGGVLRK